MNIGVVTKQNAPMEAHKKPTRQRNSPQSPDDMPEQKLKNLSLFIFKVFFFFLYLKASKYILLLKPREN